MSKDGDAAGLLVALAEYGRRWEVIVETELALHEPSTVTLIEDRPLHLRDGRVRQRVALCDARTTHAQFHVTDHAVEISGFDVTDLRGHRVGVPILEGVRETPESLAIYSAEPKRPYYVKTTLRYGPPATFAQSRAHSRSSSSAPSPPPSSSAVAGSTPRWAS